MAYRLFIDFALLSVVDRIAKPQRWRFEEHLRRIQSYPGNYSDHSRYDPAGVLIHISFFENLAIYFWIDEADRQINVLRIARRSGR